MRTAHQAGFTIVELLVSLAIMAIIISLTLPAYKGYQTSQIVVQEGKKVVSTLRLAQSQALGGVKKCTTTNTLRGWFVQFQASSYTIYSRCDSAADIELTTSQTVTLPTGITTTISPAGRDVFFQPLSKDTLFPTDAQAKTALYPFPILSPASELTITLTSPSTTTRYVIHVRRSGDMYEERL